MKKYLIALALSIVSLNAYAKDTDFEFVENNLKLSHEQWSYSVRGYFDRDYIHHEVAWQDPTKWLSVGARFADSNDVNEYRVFTTVDGLKWGYFQVQPRLEYRVYDDPLRDDYARFRTAFSVKYPVGEFTPWAKYEFYNDISNAEFEQTKAQLGIMYRVNSHIELGPFLEQRRDENWDTIYTMVATQVNVAF